MSVGFCKELIVVVRAEEERRESLPTDGSELAHCEWVWYERPLINGLYLMVLMTLRHHIEKNLVYLAARTADESVDNLKTKIGWKWKEIIRRLELEVFEEYESMEVLRHLVNSYKHHPFEEPSEELLKLLKLEAGSCASLPESNKLQKALAAFIGLGEDASYCDITERFVDLADSYLTNVENRAKLPPEKLEVVKMSDFVE